MRSGRSVFIEAQLDPSMFYQHFSITEDCRAAGVYRSSLRCQPEGGVTTPGQVNRSSQDQEGAKNHQVSFHTYESHITHTLDTQQFSGGSTSLNCEMEPVTRSNSCWCSKALLYLQQLLKWVKKKKRRSQTTMVGKLAIRLLWPPLRWQIWCS